jgi:hypothetical protein
MKSINHKAHKVEDTKNTKVNPKSNPDSYQDRNPKSFYMYYAL